MLFDKIGYYLGTFTPMFVCSGASPVNLLSDSISLSILPLFCRFSSTSNLKHLEAIRCQLE